jgi:hypothetical protein
MRLGKLIQGVKTRSTSRSQSSGGVAFRIHWIMDGSRITQIVDGETYAQIIVL